MARLHHAHPLVRWSMPLSVLALAVTSVLPLRWLGWARWFSEQAYVVVAPIAQPITMAVDLVVPARQIGPEAGERERILRDELERVRVRLAQAEQRSRDLEALVDQISRGAALNPDVEVTQLARPRIGQVGDLLLIRSGSAEGVHKGTVITAQSVQLVGRVTDADARTCRVLPINAKVGSNAQLIGGVVILDEETGRRATCLLEPAGDGTLVGEVSPPEDGRVDELQVGQTVRLFDEQWPRHAQMLVIGDVERVEPSADQPLRRRITVRPRVDLRRVSEVIVRLSGGGGR